MRHYNENARKVHGPAFQSTGSALNAPRCGPWVPALHSAGQRRRRSAGTRNLRVPADPGTGTPSTDSAGTPLTRGRAGTPGTRSVDLVPPCVQPARVQKTSSL